MRAHRTHSRPVLRAVLALLAVLALALGGLWLFLRGRAQALLAGASFRFDYTVASTAAEPSPAYAALEALDALSGSVTGVTSGDDLQLSWYSLPLSALQAGDSAQPFTDLCVKDGQVYLNVRQVYRTLLSGLTARYPVASALLPDWTLGDYITQDQLARLLGAEPAVSGAGQYSAAAFAPGQMERVQPEQALDGYLYFTPRQDTGDAEIVIGFPLRSLWGEYFDCHVLVDLPGQGLHFALTGSAQAGDSTVAAPASVMRDEDIDALAALFEAVRSLLAFVQELAGGTQ